MKVRLITLVAIAVGALPSGAAAQQSVSPPGFSSFSQYREVVPTASGSVPTSGHGGLARAGPPVQGASASATALARFVAQSTPQPVRPLSAAGLAGVGGTSVLGSVAAGARGAGGGLGLALPLILGASVMIALAGLLWRRRARS